MRSKIKKNFKTKISKNMFQRNSLDGSGCLNVNCLIMDKEFSI